MADLAHKLGILPGHTICLLDAPPDAEQMLREACPGGVTLDTMLANGRYDSIFLWPATLDGLPTRLARLQRRIVPSGAIWLVMPKKTFAARRSIAFTWEAMQAAALHTDLVDNKIAAFSAEDYATRFVIRKERRSAYT